MQQSCATPETVSARTVTGRLLAAGRRKKQPLYRHFVSSKAVFEP
jgi:hypothetical protein